MKKLIELNEEELYELEGGAMHSVLECMPDGGAGNVVIDKQSAGGVLKPLGHPW